MRILLVSDYGGLNGGAEIQFFGLRDGLRTRGHEMRVLTSTAGSKAGDPAVDYRAFGTTSSFRTFLQSANPWAASAFRQALRDFRPDVVHLNLFLTQLSPLLMRVLQSPEFETIPCVYYAQWQRALCPIGTRMLPGGLACRVPWGLDCYRNGCLPLSDWVPLMLQMRAMRTWFGAVDRVVAISHFVRERLEEASFRNVEVIQSGVNDHGPRPPLAGPPRIGFAGRLVPEKGVDVLLRACHLLHGEFPHVLLDVVGDGPDLSTVRALARELGLADCVTFHGKQSQPDMEQILQHAWVQAIPSVWEEPFGLVAVEAAMRGTAAVVSSAGGLAEIVVHGETGLHATIRPEPLAAALKVFLEDPAVAERAGAAGRRNALARFPLERNVDRFADLYARLLQAKAETA